MMFYHQLYKNRPAPVAISTKYSWRIMSCRQRSYATAVICITDHLYRPISTQIVSSTHYSFQHPNSKRGIEHLPRAKNLISSSATNIRLSNPKLNPPFSPHATPVTAHMDGRTNPDPVAECTSSNMVGCRSECLIDVGIHVNRGSLCEWQKPERSKRRVPRRI